MRPFVYHLLYILFTYLSGLFLCFAPWSMLWRNNYFTALLDPASSSISGWIRGAISGLGIINLAFALLAIYRIPEAAGRGRRRPADAAAGAPPPA